MTFFEVQDLSVGYDRPTLRSIDFFAQSGQIIGILGRNGCGKTTLLRGIAGSTRCFSGRILQDGQDCTRMGTRQRAAVLSFLPQQTQVPEGILAGELIAMGRYPHGSLLGESRETVKAHVSRAARRLGIGHLLEQDCGKLSQGQRQLVLLARMLAQDTPILLLDEPNAALDYDNSHRLFVTLQKLAREEEKLILLILHEPELALKWCDKLLLLGEGQLQTVLEPQNHAPQTLEEGLRRLYPGVTLRRDPYDRSLRCYLTENHKE